MIEKKFKKISLNTAVNILSYCCVIFFYFLIQRLTFLFIKVNLTEIELNALYSFFYVCFFFLFKNQIIYLINKIKK